MSQTDTFERVLSIASRHRTEAAARNLRRLFLQGKVTLGSEVERNRESGRHATSQGGQLASQNQNTSVRF